jgi:benzil reductase ((S)-benzoin forming)
LAVAEYYLERGQLVIGLGRRTSLSHPHFDFRALDLTDTEAVDSFEFSGVQPGDILVNNAGVIGQISPCFVTRPQNVNEVFTVNSLSAIKLANQFARQLESGIIVFISSGAAQRPIKGWGAYCASKAAVDMYAKVMQEECDFYGKALTIKSIAPGVVDSPMQAHIRSSNPKLFPDKAAFDALYTNQELDNPTITAEKLGYLLANLAAFQEVICSLRSINLPD